MRNLQLLYNDARLADLFQALDTLHTAASEGRLNEISTLSTQELMGWLQEIAYTARETIGELQEDAGEQELHTQVYRLHQYPAGKQDSRKRMGR